MHGAAVEVMSMSMSLVMTKERSNACDIFNSSLKNKPATEPDEEGKVLERSSRKNYRLLLEEYSEMRVCI